MSRVVFDIETIGFEFDSFDEKQKEYILKFAKNDDELAAVKERLGLHPLTGRIITIAMYNPESGKGCVFFDPGNDQKYDYTEENIKYESCDEETLLKKFWENIAKYDEFITFNGSRFDCPFVTLRSAILGVTCGRDMMPPRFEKKPHIDLAKVLNFYGELEKIFPLHFYCKAFGVKSPKEGEVEGHQVPKFFAEGKGLEIAQYCVGDVIATAELLKKWEKCAPPPFVKKWN
jgi:DNA polymerase elongation subunit (family B)